MWENSTSAISVMVRPNSPFRSSGVTKQYLYSELERARQGLATPDCKAGCRGGGALGLTGGKCDV